MKDLPVRHRHLRLFFFSPFSFPLASWPLGALFPPPGSGLQNCLCSTLVYGASKDNFPLSPPPPPPPFPSSPPPKCGRGSQEMEWRKVNISFFFFSLYFFPLLLAIKWDVSFGGKWLLPFSSLFFHFFQRKKFQEAGWVPPPFLFFKFFSLIPCACNS